MHKTELVDAVAEAADLTKTQAQDVVNAIFDEITNALSRKIKKFLQSFLLHVLS